MCVCVCECDECEHGCEYECKCEWVGLECVCGQLVFAGECVSMGVGAKARG